MEIKSWPHEKNFVFKWDMFLEKMKQVKLVLSYSKESIKSAVLQINSLIIWTIQLLFSGFVCYSPASKNPDRKFLS